MATQTITFRSQSTVDCLSFERGVFSRNLMVEEIPRVIGARSKDMYTGYAEHTAHLQITAATIAGVLTARAAWETLMDNTSGTLTITHADSSSTALPYCIIAPMGVRQDSEILYHNSSLYGQFISVTFIQLAK